MTMSSLLLFLLAFVLTHSVLVMSAAAVTRHPIPNSIFVLSGQSNMAGRGEVEHVWDAITPPECKPSPSILRLDASFMWVMAKEPLHADIDTKKVCGVGPGMAFTNEVLNKEPSLGVIGLVPCAIGGTAMPKWSPGTTLYNKMINRTASALRSGGKLKAFLWYQGESDALEDSDGSFAADLKSFFVSVRKDLHMDNLPIVQVAISPNTEGNYTQRIRKSQLELNFSSLITVDTKDLPLQDGKLHLSTTSQVRLGQMIADAFLKIGRHH